MSRIVLISLDRRDRTLLWAELDAAEYDVSGIPGLDEAIVRLPGQRPDLVIFDTHNQPVDAESLASLKRAAAPAPILVLTGPFDLVRFDPRAQGLGHLLVRPFFVKDVVAAVRKLVPPTPISLR